MFNACDGTFYKRFALTIFQWCRPNILPSPCSTGVVRCKTHAPALLMMGNICISNIPTVGGLVYLLTVQAFAKDIPCVRPLLLYQGPVERPCRLYSILDSGAVDALAFLGGSHAADQLIQQHPHPLKLLLQLKAKNMGVRGSQRKFGRTRQQVNHLPNTSSFFLSFSCRD
jgi:hypothetical protein